MSTGRAWPLTLLALMVALLLCGCAKQGSDGDGGDSEDLSSLPTPAGDSPKGFANLFFLHHSVGDGLITQGRMRTRIAEYNASHSTSFAFWDHGYNGDGLRNPVGTATGTNYDIPDDNTDPENLFLLWTSSEARYATCRDRILNAHQVIAFKSCFPNSAIEDASVLQQYKDWYLAMRTIFDRRPDRLFIVMSTPPLHRRATNATQARHARSFASWLCGSEYLSGHANVACFDLFDRLAAPDGSGSSANMLRYEYEASHSSDDSHPNEAANQVVGPVMADFFCQTAARYAAR
jgi:hypothetical protein